MYKTVLRNSAKSVTFLVNGETSKCELAKLGKSILFQQLLLNGTKFKKFRNQFFKMTVSLHNYQVKSFLVQ